MSDLVINRVFKLLFLLTFLISSKGLYIYSQNTEIEGFVKDIKGEKIEGVQVLLLPGEYNSITDKNGLFSLSAIPYGTYKVKFFLVGYETINESITLSHSFQKMDITLTSEERQMATLQVESARSDQFTIRRLRAVDGTSIYASKKNELVYVDDLLANKALNNGRQIFAKVAGLNIWESGEGGIQLGIGGRGLSPKRTTNFNTRQNGYDMSADALGYPESYYTPCMESVERIEIIRGAASLQYGTQFGGLLNFIMKKGEEDKPLVFESKQTIGSYGLFNSFNRIGGTKGKFQYFLSHQFKMGDSWRPNGSFELQNIYTSVYYKLKENSHVGLEYTKYFYDAQQPGGLTDILFNQDASQSIRERNWFSIDWNMLALNFDYVFNNDDKLNSRFFALSASRKSVGFLGLISRTDPLDERDLIIGDYLNVGNETRWMQKYSFGNIMGTFLLGGRFYTGETRSRQGLGDSGYGANYAFLNPNDLEGSDYFFPSFNTSFFVENYLSINDKWSITPGIRYEHIYTGSQGYFKLMNKDLAGNIIYENNLTDTFSRKRDLVLFGVGSSFKHNGAEIYGNFSQNYRAINFTDLRVNNPNLEVDTNIQDERGFNVDLGFRGIFKNVINYDLSFFMLFYKDRIGAVYRVDSATYRLYQYRTNVADSRNIGVESLFEIDILKLLNKTYDKFQVLWFHNISVIDAKYINSKESAVDQRRVELVPSFNYKTGINLSYKKLSSSIQYGYVSKQYTDATNAVFTSSAVSGIIPSYQIVDISIAYSMNKLKAELGLNNALNEIYFTRRATAYPGPGIIPSDPRVFYLTLSCKL